MSKKVVKASDDLLNLFELVKDKETSILDWIRFELRTCDEQAELYKIQRVSEIFDSVYEEHAKDSLNFIIVFNESILDKLPQNLKEMAIVECLTGISISDNDKISIKKPTINTYFGMLSKYGNDEVIKLHESVKSLFDNKKEQQEKDKTKTNNIFKNQRFNAHNLK